MSNGSEAGSGACGVPLPGHMMPVGADALKEKGFRDWVASVHPVFAETKLADLLIEMGYESVRQGRGSRRYRRGHAPRVVWGQARARDVVSARGSGSTKVAGAKYVKRGGKRGDYVPRSARHEAAHPSAEGATGRQLVRLWGGRPGYSGEHQGMDATTYIVGTIQLGRGRCDGCSRHQS